MIEKARSSIFFISAEIDISDIAVKLGDEYAVSGMKQEEVNEEYLDTFEWGLYRAGKALARNGRRYTIYSSEGVVECRGKGPRKKRPFRWDFAEGLLQQTIAEAVDIRALSPFLQVTRIRQPYNLLNEDEKIVLKIWLDRTVATTEGGKPVELILLHLAGIRGYEHEFQAVHRLLCENGLEEAAQGEHFLGPVLTKAKIATETVGAKSDVILAKDISISGGLRQVGLAVLHDIRRNLPGTINDIDTEFLHDLRIAFRRSRSLLSIFARILPENQCNHFRSEFRWITQATGKVRDSDVYLLQEDIYRSMLPASLHPGLAGFVRGLRSYRNREFRTMKKLLSSSRLARLLKDWQRFLENLPQGSDKAGEEGLCRDFAAKAVKKRFKKIILQGEMLGPESPDAMLHALRIEAKKFRYLLEFFHSLFAPEAVEPLVRHLKRLQSNLGDFNDLSVQQAMLGSFRSPGKIDDPQLALAVAAALGGLVTRLAEQQVQVRGECEAVFADFAGSENRELVRAITRSTRQEIPQEKKRGPHGDENGGHI